MKTRYCPICGGEIVFHYETPTKVYCIENDTLIRDDNNINDNSELTPYCSNNKEHSIEPEDEKENREFWSWFDSINTYFFDRGIYDL